MDEVQKETDSLGEVDVAADKLRGAMGFVTEDEFARVVDPVKMVKPYVAIAE
jgi:fumarate hydratase class II